MVGLTKKNRFIQLIWPKDIYKWLYRKPDVGILDKTVGIDKNRTTLTAGRFKTKKQPIYTKKNPIDKKILTTDLT